MAPGFRQGHIWVRLRHHVPVDPTLALATAVENVPFKHASTVYGVHELPVTW